jgi:hypothetical protein
LNRSTSEVALSVRAFHEDTVFPVTVHHGTDVESFGRFDIPGPGEFGLEMGHDHTADGAERMGTEVVLGTIKPLISRDSGVGFPGEKEAEGCLNMGDKEGPVLDGKVRVDTCQRRYDVCFAGLNRPFRAVASVVIGCHILDLEVLAANQSLSRP